VIRHFTLYLIAAKMY